MKTFPLSARHFHEVVLAQVLDAGKISVVLDVWQGEPDINQDLLEKAEIATPHIAGYSYDGKVSGTQMIYQAACKFLGVEPEWRPCAPRSGSDPKILNFSDDADDREVIKTAILASYDVRLDDAKLRAVLHVPPKQVTPYFDSLRKNYPVRREFNHTELRIPTGRGELAQKLRALGFAVKC